MKKLYTVGQPQTPLPNPRDFMGPNFYGRPFFKMAAAKIEATLISAKMHVINHVYTNL